MNHQYDKQRWQLNDPKLVFRLLNEIKAECQLVYSETETEHVFERASV